MTVRERRGLRGLERSIASLFAGEFEAPAPSTPDSAPVEVRLGPEEGRDPPPGRETDYDFFHELSSLSEMEALRTADDVAQREADPTGGRRTRARALREPVVDPELLEVLELIRSLSGLRTEEERAAVIQTLAGLPSRLAPELGAALNRAQRPAVRRALGDALAAKGAEGARTAEAMMESGGAREMGDGAFILGLIGSESALDRLRRSLEHPTPLVRRESVRALGRIGGREAGALVAARLRDPVAEVRASAAGAIQAMEASDLEGELEEALQAEEEEEVQVAILGALGAVCGEAGIPALEKKAVGTLFSRPSTEVRVAAYRGLARVGSPAAVSVLRRALSDRSPAIRSVVRGLLRS